MPNMPRWGWAALAALAIVIAVLATLLVAGGSNDKTTDTTTTSSSTTTSSTSTTSTTAPVVTTTTAKPNTTCQASQLAAHITDPDSGAGQRYSKLIYTNNSPKDCTMFGFPGLQLTGMGGSNIPTNVVRTNNKPKILVTLQAGGGQAYTTLHWGVIPGQGEPQNGDCEPNPENVKLTSPNATGSLTQPWTFGSVCEHGSIDVDAMAPGSGN